MTPEYPTNSSLMLGAQQTNAPQLPSPPKKAESVVSGKTKATKGLRKFILEQDFRDVKKGVVDDIVRPRIKEIIYDIFKGFLNSADSTLQMMIFGEERRNPNRPGDRASFNYNQVSRRPQMSTSPSMTSAFNCDDITYETRGDAEAVLEYMYAYISEYKAVTVANMYEFSNLQAPWTANNYGWTDLTGASIRSCFDGSYVINLPRPRPLNS